MAASDIKRLRELCEQLVQRAESQPATAKALADLIAAAGKIVDIGKADSPPLPRRTGRRAAPVIDPFELHRQGPDVLSEQLHALDLEQLRDIVAHYGMDPRRLVMKWKTPGRVVEHVIETVEARSRKGEVFRGSERSG